IVCSATAMLNSPYQPEAPARDIQYKPEAPARGIVYPRSRFGLVSAERQQVTHEAVQLAFGQLLERSHQTAGLERLRVLHPVAEVLALAIILDDPRGERLAAHQVRQVRRVPALPGRTLVFRAAHGVAAGARLLSEEDRLAVGRLLVH